MPDPADRPVLALDLGGTSLRAALVLGGRVTERREGPTPRPARPDAVIGAALDLAAPLASRASALGLACAGAVVGGRVTATAAHTFPGWTDVALGERLGGALGLRSAVLNDARAAAWGEYVAGAGRGGRHREFMFVTVSTGVGAGLILGGRLHLAGNGLDAELGFTSVPAQWHTGATVPGVGALGPLEFETSGTALGEQARALGCDLGCDLGWEDARDLADAAEAGDALADAPYARSAALIAWKVADVAALLGVTGVALGGSVGLRPGYLARVRSALTLFPERYRPEVGRAALGADAGLIGAAQWARDLADCGP